MTIDFLKTGKYAAAFIALAGALSVGSGLVYSLLPFAKATDLIQVAGVSYSTAISELERQAVWLQMELKSAEAQGDQTRIRELRAMVAEAERKLQELRSEKQKFQ